LLDRQFKQDKSNCKIVIVVDMWLTGFDVPFLDTVYIDKPVTCEILLYNNGWRFIISTLEPNKTR
jgi:superfamily II DNA or RNA helicase